MQLLIGHISQETAYVVEDYPYGFRLRCKIRYWLEFHARHGFRLVSQTTNPKRGHVWNKPKASTYCRFGGCMYSDAAGHVQWSGLTEYCSGAEAQAWREMYGAGVPDAGRNVLNQWVAAKVAYDANRKSGDPLAVGLKEARDAFFNTAVNYVTARELQKLSSPAQSPQYMMTVPAGARCKIVDGRFVVDDTSKVTGGNQQDLVHYYIWLDDSEVVAESANV